MPPRPRLTIALRDGRTLTIAARGRFVCADAQLAEVCNLHWPAEDPTPQNPDPDRQRANLAAHALGGTITDTRPPAPFDPTVVY